MWRVLVTMSLGATMTECDNGRNSLGGREKDAPSKFRVCSRGLCSFLRLLS